MPQQNDPPPPSDPTGVVHLAFVAAWQRQRTPFDRWIRSVTDEFERSQRTRSPLGLNEAALVTGATQAEIAAVLRLGSLDDDSLRLLSQHPPPMTTWLVLGEATPDLVRVAVQALDQRSSGERASVVLARALGLTNDGEKYGRLARISGESLLSMARRASEYEVLRPKDRKFLYSIGQRFKAGNRDLSPAQMTYLEGTLETLSLAGLLKSGPEDSDKAACEEVAKALIGSG